MPSWKHVDIKTKQGFRGLAAVDATTAWVGGSEGGVWRTTDAGKTWDKVGPELDEAVAVPRHRGDRRRPRADPLDRPRPPVPHLPHRRRRADLGAHLHQQGPGGVLRLHGDVPRRRPRARDERPGGRQVPDRPPPRTAAAPGRSSPARACPRPSTASSASRPAGPAWSPPARATPTSAPAVPPAGSSSPRTTARPGRSATAGSPRPTRAASSPWRSRTRRPASPSAATSPSPTTARRPRRTAPARTGPRGGDLGGYRSGVAWLSGEQARGRRRGADRQRHHQGRRAVLEGLRRRVLRRGDVRRRRHLLGVRGRGRGGDPPPLTPDRSVSCYRTVTFQGWSRTDNAAFNGPARQGSPHSREGTIT